jgi:hypothetical protein
MDAVLEERITWLAEAATAVGAKALVVPTLGEVRTGPRDRERLATYFGALTKALPNTPMVWEPGGLWDAEEAEPFAAKLGVAYAFDPLDVPPAPLRVRELPKPARGGSIAYLRIKGIGARARLGEGALAVIIEAIASRADAETIFVAIESPRSVREATRLLQLVEA